MEIRERALAYRILCLEPDRTFTIVDPMTLTKK
jgi:hypothetical protein